MISKDIETSWQPIVVFSIYGVLLFVAGLMLSAMGEGPTLALAVFGSPISVTGVVFSIPAVWLLFGFLLGANFYRSAALLLIFHLVIAPFSVMRNLANRSWHDEWSLFVQMARLDPTTTLVLLMIYASGQLLAWRFVAKGILRSPSATRRISH